MPKFDVVIVGARCAGSPLALLLARQGLRVCIVDRATFPSDTPSTHVLQPSGVAVLHRLGVLDAIAATRPAVLDQFTLVIDDVRVEANIGDRPAPDARFGGAGLCIRRVVLDELLVAAAEAAGVDVRTGTNVTGLVMADDGRVCGVRTAHGDITARLVVGADGRRSTIADAVAAGTYYVERPGRLFAWGYFAGVANREGRLRIGRVGEYAYAAAPTDAGLYLAAVCPAMTTKERFLADREQGFLAGLRAWPELTDLLAGADRVGPLRVVADWQGCFRAATGPGWVLVGDAGHFKDPSPAQGMADALRHAERLAEVVAGNLDGDLDAALRAWWRWRDLDMREMHWFASDIGDPDAGPVVTQFMRDLAAQPTGGLDLLRVLNHELRPSELLTTPRMVRAALRASTRRGQLRPVGRELRAVARAELRRSRARRSAPIALTERHGNVAAPS